MYFDSVLSYLATFINDISLMNLSNETSRPSFIYLRFHLVLVSVWSFSSIPQLTPVFSNSIFLFSIVNKLRSLTPFLLGLQR